MKTNSVIPKSTRMLVRCGIALALVVSLMALSSPGAMAASPGWASLAVPLRSGYLLDLNGIWGTDEHNVIAVGDYWEPDTYSHFFPMIVHFDGHKLRKMVVPDETEIRLNDVWGSAKNDVYAVGGTTTPGSNIAAAPYMLHYDGTAWSESALPDLGDVNVLICIWGLAANDIYIGGGDTIIRFDGTAWTPMDTSCLNVYLSPEIKGIWGSAANDLFAIVRYTGATDYNTLIMHYDGTAWSVMTTITDYIGRALWGFSGTDVFAVGYEAGKEYMVDEVLPRIFHYDGIAWTEMDMPDLSPMSHPFWGGKVTGFLYDVWGSSNDNVYAGGFVMLLHYDGQKWTQQQDAYGSSFWGSSKDHVFKADYTMAKLGLELTSTTGITLRVATGTSVFERFVPLDPATISDTDGRPENLPYGLFDFTIPVTPGDRATVIFELPTKLDDTYDWWKHAPDTGWYRVENADFSNFINWVGQETTLVSFDVTDNGAGDHDPRPGYISDPSGPGNEGTAAAAAGGGGGCFIPALFDANEK